MQQRVTGFIHISRAGEAVVVHFSGGAVFLLEVEKKERMSLSLSEFSSDWKITASTGCSSSRFSLLSLLTHSPCLVSLVADI
jgi:hypothetical protein